MPAETHHQRDSLSPADLVNLLVVVLTTDTDGPSAGPDTLMTDIGADDDLALLDLWAAMAEEYGERTLGEVDLVELRTVETIGELADMFARCSVAGQTLPTVGRGDPA